MENETLPHGFVNRHVDFLMVCDLYDVYMVFLDLSLNIQQLKPCYRMGRLKNPHQGAKLEEMPTIRRNNGQHFQIFL